MLFIFLKQSICVKGINESWLWGARSFRMDISAEAAIWRLYSRMGYIFHKFTELKLDLMPFPCVILIKNSLNMDYMLLTNDSMYAQCWQKPISNYELEHKTTHKSIKHWFLSFSGYKLEIFCNIQSGPDNHLYKLDYLTLNRVEHTR